MVLIRHLSRSWLQRFVGVFLALMMVALIALLLDIHQNTSLATLGLRWVGLLLFMQMPYMMSLILPTASFFSWVLLFSDWAEKRMLLVMHLCGYHKQRLLKGPLLTATFVMVCSLLTQPIGVYMSHWVQEKAEDSWVNQTMQDWPAKQFIPLPHKRVMYAQSEKKHQLQGIWWLENPKFSKAGQMPKLRFVHAKSAHRKEDGVLILKDGHLYEVDWHQDNIKIAAFQSYHWRLMMPLSWKHWMPSLRDLWQHRHHDPEARLALYWQCAWLTMAWVLACWSVWIAGGVYGSVGRKMVSALMVYFGYLSSLAIGAYWVSLSSDFYLWQMLIMPSLSASLALTLIKKKRN